MTTNPNSCNKLNNLETMKHKLETMLSKSKEELHSLEVEWLHLRSLALRDERSSNQNKSTTNLEPNESNFDDIKAINSQQFNMNTVESVYIVNHKDNLSAESESEDDI